jgi:hypothetical protein
MGTGSWSSRRCSPWQSFALSHWNGSRMGKHGAVWLLLATLVCHRFSNFSDDISQLDYLFAFGGAALFVVLSFH